MSLNKREVEHFFKRTGYDLESGRETMDALRSKFNRIKRQLKEANRFESTDEILIETLVMAIEIRDRSLVEISINGVLMFVDRRKKVKQKNHAISSFMQMSKIIENISEKLGMSPLDRHNLKIQREENDGMKENEERPNRKKK